jgi:hypothetical protein
LSPPSEGAPQRFTIVFLFLFATVLVGVDVALVADDGPAALVGVVLITACVFVGVAMRLRRRHR